MTEYQKIHYADAKLAHAALMKYYPLWLEDIDGEEWREVDGYEGLYQISNYGRLKSSLRDQSVILKPTANHDGYLYYNLHINGRSKHLLAHRLVAQMFIPNPDGKETVNHIDGCKMNNYVDNLEWATHKDNSKHAVKIGLIKSNEDCRYAKLTNEQVAYCRSVYIPRHPEFGGAALARKFGVNNAAMAKILSGKTYKDVK